MAEGVPFGPYFLMRRLGAGGMAEVFLAKRTGPGGFEKKLVLKRILPHLSSSEELVQMFLREAQLAARLEHPNLVHVSDFGEVEGSHYLAMEFVDGMTVAQVCATVGSLRPDLACRVAVDLLEALQVIHGAESDLVHRDVSPRNVMVTRDGAVKLLDFGIAVPSDVSGIAAIGTRRFMSPEQLDGRPLDARADLFCVGAVLYFMLAGQPPFDERPTIELVRPDGVPDRLWAVLTQTLSSHPDDRPGSARALAQSIEAILIAEGGEGTRARLGDVVRSLEVQRTRRKGRLTEVLSTAVTASRRIGRSRLVVGVAAVLLLSVASVTWWIWPTRTLESPAVAEHRAERGRGPVAERVGGRGTAQAPGQSATLPAAERRRARRAPASTGTLSIDTRPWTEVFLGGKKLGMTPLGSVELPVGKHVLELRNPKKNLVKRVPVSIRTNQETRLNLSLR